MSKYIGIASEIITHERAVDTDGHQEAAHAFHKLVERHPEYIEDLETGDVHEVLGICESCPTYIFEGDRHAIDEDGVLTCAKHLAPSAAEDQAAPGQGEAR